jgi:hypothetical protein
MSNDITTPTVTIRELRRAQQEVDDILWRIRSNRADYLDARITMQRSWLRRTRSSLVVLAVVATVLLVDFHVVATVGWTEDSTGAVILPGFVGVVSLFVFSAQLSSRSDARATAGHAWKRMQELRALLGPAKERRDWASRWHELVSATTPEQMAAGGIVVPEKPAVR